MMYKIRTEFVKNKLKGLELNRKNKEYIENLIKLEQRISGESFGMMTSYINYMGKNSYPKEYKAIYQELNPQGWKDMKAWEKKEREEEKREEAEQKEEDLKDEQDFKKMWAKTDGVIR